MTVPPTKPMPLLCAAMRDVGGDDGSDLRALVSHRYVIEVLDALSNGPMTLADIRSAVRAGSVDVNAELDSQLDGLERHRFALAWSRLRPATGKSSICFPLMTWRTDALCVWSNGDSPVTVTDSLMAATNNRALLSYRS